MLYFTRWKALAIILTALVVCLCAVPNFFPEAQVKTWPVWAQRHLVLGLDLQGGPHILLEVESNSGKKDKLDQVRDDVRRTLRDAKIGYTGLAVRNDAVEVRVKDTDVPNALAKLRDLSQPLGALLGSSGQRRARAPVGRAVDPDRRAPRQRTRHRGAADSAPGRRPYSGAGAGLAGSDPLEGIARQNRKARFPHGRSHGPGGPGAAGQGA